MLGQPPYTRKPKTKIPSTAAITLTMAFQRGGRWSRTTSDRMWPPIFSVWAICSQTMATTETFTISGTPISG